MSIKTEFGRFVVDLKQKIIVLFLVVPNLKKK